MTTIDVVVDEALGPGLDIVVRDGAPAIAGVRAGTAWLGLDRGHLEESDAGDGTELPALIALPVSSFAGCRVSVETAGALAEGVRTVLVTRLPGQPLPPLSIVRTVARLPEGRWLEAEAAERLALEGRQRHRVRRQQGRVVGGRAWQPVGRDPGERRFTTPHSRSEYRLNRLPPRFVRGLEGLLDPEERILYAVERPPDSVRRGPLGLGFGRGAERRAGLLLLTDRQLVWMVDHLPPDRHLLDWGIDARFVAVEALCGIRVGGREVVELEVATRGGSSVFLLPGELRAEADVMADLLHRFLPADGTRSLLRRYAPGVADFDPEVGRLFGQEDEAMRSVRSLGDALAPEPVLAAFYAPRREASPRPATAAVTATRVALVDGPAPHLADLAGLRDIAITLSPLVGRVTLAVPAAAGGEALRPAERRRRGRSRADQGLEFTYPATASAHAAAFIRHLRKAWADRASAIGSRAI